MSPLIAYWDFPHLIDAIIASTTWRTQLQLRHVCRSFRHAVDRHQSFHVVLVPHTEDDSAVTALYAYTATRLPAFSTIGPSSWSQLPVHPKLALAACTRVLDIRGVFPATCNLHLLRSAFPNLTTLRFCTTRDMWQSCIHDVPFDAKTHVLFADPLASGNTLLSSGVLPPNFEAIETEEPEPAIRGINYEGDTKATKIVINMFGDHIPLEGTEPPHVKEMVLVVACYEGHTLGTSEEYIFARNIAKVLKPGVKYTVVGLESISRRYGQVFRNKLREQLCDIHIKDVAKDYERKPGELSYEESLKEVCKVMAASGAVADSLMSQVELISQNAYIQRIGDEAALELLEYFEDRRI